MALTTFLANLKHAVQDSISAYVGGGEFTADEQRLVILQIEQAMHERNRLLCAAKALIAEADKNGVSSLYENRDNNPHVELCEFGRQLRELRALTDGME